MVAVFEANQTAYMVMQYEKGESLSEILRRFGTLSEAEIVRHLLPLLDGLKKVHEAGFIHRDIKPSNIFTRKGGASSVLLDFGSARHALSLETRTLTNLVSPGYSPYEQYSTRSDEQGPWTDIYAAGATLYHMVVGVAPLDAIERGKGMLGSARDVLKPAVAAGKGRYSVGFLSAIDRALMFNKEDRPQFVDDWLQDFQQVASVLKYRRRAVLPRQPAAPASTKSPAPGSGAQAPTGPLPASEQPTAVLAPVVEATVSRSDAQKRKRWAAAALASGVVIAGLVLWIGNREAESPGIGEPEPPVSGAVASQDTTDQEEQAQNLLAEIRAEAERLQALRENADTLAEKLASGRNELSTIEQKREEEEERIAAAQGILQRTEEESQRLEKAAADARSETLRLEKLKQDVAAVKPADVPAQPPAAQPESVAGPDSQAASPEETQLFDGISAFESGQYAEAHRILAPLAEQGQPEAQRRLASMYAAGRGVKQDFAQAANWYQKVAEQGDGQAQFSLAGMYESGTGVPQSYMMAYVWYTIAARLGNTGASESLTRIANQLQPMEIRQADKLISARLAQIQKQ